MRFAFACSAAFAALAGLVATGVTNGIDQWAVDHAMPGAHFSGQKPTTAEGLVPLLHAHWHGTVHILAELVTLPAAFLTSLLVLALLRRWEWLWVWAAANVVEELCKLALTRPGVHDKGLHLAAFDNSYPSGHTLRAVVIAAAWPPARPWAVAAIAMLEIGGFHVPTDIVGALLLAGVLLGARRARQLVDLPLERR